MHIFGYNIIFVKVVIYRITASSNSSSSAGSSTAAVEYNSSRVLTVGR